MLKFELKPQMISIVLDIMCKKHGWKICSKFYNPDRTIAFDVIFGGDVLSVKILQSGFVEVNNDVNEDFFSKIFNQELKKIIFSPQIKRLQEFIKVKNAIVFLDLTNMFHWQDKLSWSFHVKNLIKFLVDVDGVKEVRVYYGKKVADERNGISEDDERQSQNFFQMMREAGAIIRDKKVKMIEKSIKNDGSKVFFTKRQMSSFSSEATQITELLVTQLEKDGQLTWREPKCNFDVEIALDMIDTVEKVENFILFSGDCDFLEIAERVRLKSRNFIVCCASGYLSEELRENNDELINFSYFRPICERVDIKSKNPPIKRIIE